EEKLLRTRERDLPRELPPVIRRKGALDLEDALDRGEVVYTTQIRAAITQASVNRHLARRELEKEGAAAVRPATAFLAQREQLRRHDHAGYPALVKKPRDARVEQVDISDERHVRHAVRIHVGTQLVHLLRVVANLVDD